MAHSWENTLGGMVNDAAQIAFVDTPLRLIRFLSFGLIGSEETSPEHSHGNEIVEMASLNTKQKQEPEALHANSNHIKPETISLACSSVSIGDLDCRDASEHTLGALLNQSTPLNVVAQLAMETKQKQGMAVA